MFKKSQYSIALIALFFMFALFLGACNQKDSEPVDRDKEDENDQVTDESTSDPVEGGTITGAMYSAPTGMFNPIFYEEAYEANILDFTHESLFSQDEELGFEPNLAEDWELNDDQTEMTVHLNEGVTWHDGKEFTAHDVVFTYQAIADPDYVKAGGVRTSPYAASLLGYEEYNDGETEEFSGVVAEDDYTVIFKFQEPSVTPEYIANFPIIPKHVFEDIPVIDIPEAAASLEPGEVIGTGPFKFTEMVEREQYVLERHEDYWKDKPYLDKIVWKIIEQSVMTGLLEKGEIDFVADPGGIPPADFDIVDDYGNINIIEQADFGYQLLGFKMNHRTDEDVEDGVIEPDNWVENEKLPKEVRQAIAYAIDRVGIVGEGHGEGLLHGRGQPINSPIALQFWAYDDEAAFNYTQDLDKAAELLDEAGYELGDDGFRTDPNGDEWILNMDYPTGNELREKVAPLIKEYLEEVGIEVNLRQPKEMSTYVPELEDDNTDWDLYLIGWSLGSGDPDPLGLWGINDAYNFSRWNNPDSDELLNKALKAPEAFEQDYRAEVYSEWQELFSEDLPALLLFAENKLWAHDELIHGIKPLPHTMYQDSHLWWLENDE
ncbi:MAG TPA: peptide-binding protein [Virgibacillus sp.]|nr:peptide-binding protein [Virgibacillus sp.]